ncbi:BTB/POZ protein [Jimgerdemannia flammicorona]|uniref:BTB/POZ protein n=1 Tax=Jimgerdemannia flammicorona TaxID=994334 RepID=A0A433QQ70_9FUNG|nr:BTB/POZ protein [Jimgerdemannia flammicorona]
MFVILNIKGTHEAAKRPFENEGFPDDKLFISCRILSSRDRRFFLPRTLLAGLSTQFNNVRTADVEFRVGPGASPLYAHRGMLSTRSKYFADMFDSDPRTVIEVPDVGYLAFEALLKYIYYDQTEFDDDINPADLSLLAVKYRVPLVVDITEPKILGRLNPRLVCQLLATHSHVSSTLKDGLIEYISQKKF